MNHHEIEDILAQCSNGQTYDIVLNSKQLFINIGQIKIRYLNYSAFNGELSLHDPQCLLSASISKVKIANLSQCTNLENLVSWQNSYC